MQRSPHELNFFASGSRVLGHQEPVISILPASVIGLMLFLVHFFVIYWYKIIWIPQFSEASLIDQFVHVLANTIVVIPFMTWDVQNDGNSPNEPSMDLSDNGECVCLRRCASADQLTRSDDAFKTKRGHRRSTSDTTGMRDVKEAVDMKPLGPIHENICFANSRSV